MSFDYASAAATAKEMLTDFGASAILRRVGGTSPVYDPATGTMVPGAPAVADENLIAVVIDYPEAMIDGTLIQTNDLQVFVSPVGVVEPKASDLFIWQGEQFVIVKHKELAPAGVNVLYEWQVRK